MFDPEMASGQFNEQKYWAWTENGDPDASFSSKKWIIKSQDASSSSHETLKSAWIATFDYKFLEC